MRDSSDFNFSKVPARAVCEFVEKLNPIYQNATMGCNWLGNDHKYTDYWAVTAPGVSVHAAERYESGLLVIALK